MNMYLKVMTAASFIAFTIIKKANFHLNPDNIGWIATLAGVGFFCSYISMINIRVENIS